MRRLAITLLALFTTSLTWAENLELLNGYTLNEHSENCYEITSTADWNALADYVEAGNSCSGLTFIMTTDIAVERTIGFQTNSNANSRKRFSGTFDGGGNTLTVNLTADNMGDNKNYCAPFAYVENASFKNLTVEGTVNTLTYKFGAGLVGSMTGGGDIENCHIGITLNSGMNGDGTHASFIAIVENDITVNISDSWFDGKFLGKNTTNCGGIVGYNKGTVNFINCLFNPSEVTFNANHSSDLSATFARKDKTSRINNIVNSYYTQALGIEEIGSRMVCSEDNKQDFYTYQEVTAADGVNYYYITGNNLWNILNSDLNKNDGKTVELSQDIIAGTESNPLVIGENVTATLDLKGHTINRNLTLETAAIDNGYAIKVSEGATLNIIDTEKGGLITGSKNTGNGGAILSQGTLNLMGGTISGNNANLGGGVYADKGTVNVSGTVSIKGNRGKSSANDIYVNNKAIVTVNSDGIFEAETVSIKNGGSFVVEDGGQLITRATEARFTFKKEIKAYDKDLNNNWYLIAPSTKNPFEISNMVTTSDYDLYRLNGTTWENSKNENHADFTSLNNGIGYLYANESDVTLQFTGRVSVYDDKTNSYNLVEGWNLVGNPYTFNVYPSISYYVMNDEGTGMNANIKTSKDALAPCTGIVVKALSDEEKIAFRKEAPKGAAANGNLELTLTQSVATRNSADSKTLDNAIVCFDLDSQLEKFYFGENKANIYFRQNNADYAIAYSNGHSEMPVNFKAKENGEYTLTVETANCQLSTVNYLHLIDNIAGTDIDLLAEPSYTFSAKNDDYESRFCLVFNAKQDGNAVENEHFAFVSNDEIIINGEGTIQIVDILGRPMLTKDLSTLNSKLSTLNFTPGIYVLRLINGNEIKNQKIIIK